MLRAARFVARYGLRPEDSMWRAVRAMAERLQIVSAERIRDELDKLLAAPLPGEGLRFVADTGLLHHVVPELAASTSQTDEACHPHLWGHTVDLVDAVPPADAVHPFDRRLVRLAALLHPLGGSRARRRLIALRHSNETVRDVTALIELSAALLPRLDADDSDEAWNDGAVRRYVRDVGRLRAELRALVRTQVEVYGSAGERMRAGMDSLESSVARLAGREPLDDLGPQLDGAQVMAVLGVGPGRAVGEALLFLAGVRLDDGIVATDQLRARLEQWWIDHQQG
jgi:poly(A) polymerase